MSAIASEPIIVPGTLIRGSVIPVAMPSKDSASWLVYPTAISRNGIIIVISGITREDSNFTRVIGVLFEISVLKDVMFGPYNFFKDMNKAQTMAKAALEKIGIDESYYDKSPFDLSGGEKRKVAIAGVLASNPQVLIMDEPTSSLDPIATKEMMELVKRLNQEGKMIIIISHDTDLCYEYADRVIIMKDGKVVKDCDVCDAFDDKSVLEKASLIEPFVYKVKRTLNIEDRNIRSMDRLKEVITSE